MYTPIFGLSWPPEVTDPRYFWHATDGTVGSVAGHSLGENSVHGGNRKLGRLCRSGKTVQGSDGISYGHLSEGEQPEAQGNQITCPSSSE